jgi:hypothetical protein
MAITPTAIQELLDELESSKQGRLRAWNVLHRLRLDSLRTGNVAIPSPAQKTFDAEGEALEHALTSQRSENRVRVIVGQSFDNRTRYFSFKEVGMTS